MPTCYKDSNLIINIKIYYKAGSQQKTQEVGLDSLAE